MKWVWIGEKERASRLIKENMFIPANVISSCMDVFVLFLSTGLFLYGFSALQEKLIHTLVSLVAPLYHPVYGWIEKIFQLIPKYFEAFNTNYSTGLNLVNPITCLYRREALNNCICVCQPCLQNKRECNFRNLLLKIIRHSFVIMLLSVVCVPMCFLFIIIVCVSLYCLQK